MEPLKVDTSAGRILLINETEQVIVLHVDNSKFVIEATNPAAVDLLQFYTFRDLCQHFTLIHVGTPEEVGGVDVRIWIKLGNDTAPETEDDREEAHSRPEIHFEFAFELMKWARPWTVTEFGDALKAVVKSRSIEGLTLFTWDEAPDLGFTAVVASWDDVMGEEVQRWREILRSIHKEATAQCIAAQHAGSLVETFHFPASIATACEQYLVYFVQFLADLGIQAEAEVQHKAAEVLFRVTPAEGPEALERIREALDAYLRLPTDPSFAVVAAGEKDLAVRQLEANVFHLQGQLAIAKAVLQAKDAAIEALELSNYRLRQIGGGEILSAGSGGGPAAGEDSEAIIPGVVSVKEVEKGGFVLHTPEILRKLKRRFGGAAEG